jgi:hypothetical protein
MPSLSPAQVAEERVLVFQSDTLLCASGRPWEKLPTQWSHLAYVGAPWSAGPNSWVHSSGIVGGGNGGLSLRSRSAALQAIAQMQPNSVAADGKESGTTEDVRARRQQWHACIFLVPLLCVQISARCDTETAVCPHPSLFIAGLCGAGGIATRRRGTCGTCRK